MSALAVLGVVLAIAVDVAVPLVFAFLLIRRNHRRRSTSSTEKVFWIVSAAYLALVILIAISAVRDVYAFQGTSVVLVTLFAFPFGSIPAVLNSTVIHYFFTDAEWASGGYQLVLVAYVVGMVGWAFLNAAGLRAVISLARHDRRAATAS
jgi:hypothetical protein